jgi:hypothetical protein
MKEHVLILEVGGDGGSIKFIQNGSTYFYTTDETAMMDLLPGEFNIEDLTSASIGFTSFDDALKSLINKYPLFSLYPLTIHPEYRQRISEYFIRYLETADDQFAYGVDNWNYILNLK